MKAQGDHARHTASSLADNVLLETPRRANGNDDRARNGRRGPFRESCVTLFRFFFSASRDVTSRSPAIIVCAKPQKGHAMFEHGVLRVIAKHHTRARNV